MGESENPFADVIYNSDSFEDFGKDLLDWYYDYQVTLWTVLLTVIAVRFFLPSLMLLLLSITVLYLEAFRYYYKTNGCAFTPKCWEGARSFLASLWDFHSWIWYGYEIEGLENIPDKGPALIVFYHGANPVDIFFLMAKTIIYKERLICSVGDRFLFSLPGFNALSDCFQVCTGTVETCADILKKGNLLAISPGGAREALFGDENYRLMWGARKGFAKVAIMTKVPIIPVFTENIREAFLTLSFGKNWLRAVYERTRIPVVPIVGGYPVKLKTHVGQPVDYNPDLSPGEVAAKVADRMEEMIKKHQKLPGSLSRSIFQRIQHLF